MHNLWSVLFCYFLSGAQAENATPYTEAKLPLLSVIMEIPATAWSSIKYSFTKESIPAWAVIVSTTALTFHYDEDLYAGSRHSGRVWGIGNDDKTKTVLEGFGYDLVRLPTDLGSGMYFLGDGWMHMAMAGGFFATGAIGGDSRPYNTGLQIVHGMITSTIFSQAIKRVTGRESPNNSTLERGAWRPLPNVPEYQRRTAKYDAFPSGHIMTATLVFTVINTNYPEYFNYVFPLEVVWLTALGFEMMNNGVHWASDYPLGIGIGYAVGKMATRMTLKDTDEDGQKEARNWMLFPSVGSQGPELNAVYFF